MTEAQLGEWLHALRSGEYRQGQTKLKQVYAGVTRYCCLGVLSKLHGYSGYPDVTDCMNFAKELIKLNDSGPIDQYARVICELESALELYITSV